ncbi:class I SAM-dependent methyltransferase [Frankia sp. AgB1.9]|uniref:class I SAM-dependent methyltransferase n=1 Tax=unclassified Frankia TaxID=2632575 RepID=UPI001932ADD0|nr:MULTISPECIES: class I SAM-dependent methyltransferase [unclassified Frankia]MBL7490280.1 class I SAM-dependent methyltransferase [Frankia sp. AgW1.1]MBL7549866.1 class I SAM-dependent methyltransferase [Frankia sp. AgB1.9]MBL7623018.1 class I SAM-dependent methyltransferase [Frankia sp. AgB1.8]
MTGTTELYTSGEYLGLNPGWHDDDGAWKALQIARILERNNLHPNSVCDVGCGTGRVLRELSHHLPGTPRMVGFDIAAAPLGLSEDAGDGVELVAGDARASDEHFDLLMMVDVFEHVEDYLGFLRTFRDRAGAFVFHIPLDMSVQTVLRAKPLLGARRGVGHLHYFSRATALVTLADAGYRVIDEAYTRGGVELAVSGRRRVARVPRQVAHRLNPDLAARVLGGFSLLVLAEGA